jgi:hypothetical protein
MHDDPRRVLVFCGTAGTAVLVVSGLIRPDVDRFSEGGFFVAAPARGAG